MAVVCTTFPWGVGFFHGRSLPIHPGEHLGSPTGWLLMTLVVGFFVTIALWTVIYSKPKCDATLEDLAKRDGEIVSLKAQEKVLANLNATSREERDHYKRQLRETQELTYRLGSTIDTLEEAKSKAKKEKKKLALEVRNSDVIHLENRNRLNIEVSMLKRTITQQDKAIYNLEKELEIYKNI